MSSFRVAERQEVKAFEMKYLKIKKGVTRRDRINNKQIRRKQV